MFASSKNEPERFAREDICFAAGTFPEGFPIVIVKLMIWTFVWRWFEQAKTIEAIANAALAGPITRDQQSVVRLLRGG